MKITLLNIFLILLNIIFFGGCQAFKSSVKEVPTEESKPMGAQYDQLDLKSWSKDIADLILKNPFPPENIKNPKIVDFGIQNRTSSHIDTKALSNNIVSILIDSNLMQFITTDKLSELLLIRHECEFKNSTQEMRKEIATDLGANYILRGFLTEIVRESGKEVRVSKKKDIYYQLDIEMIELKTGIVILKKQIDRIRKESKPIIGW